MDTNKLRVKIGEYEFDAEGPTDVVQQQFAAFKEMIATLPANVEKPAQEKKQEEPASAGQSLVLDKIMKVEGRIVALTAHSNEIDQAILLVMLGQKAFRNNDAVTGGEIIDGLKESGHVVSRVDYILDKLASQGNVIKVGLGRASRYRLTTKGHTRAMEIAREVIQLVA
jgi:hypothetical protein